MWLEKLAEGVLQLDTPIGARYIQLKFMQRAYLLWMFRHFPSLPHQVLSLRQQWMIERLCEENGFASLPGMGTPEAPVIGRIERRSPIADVLSPRKPVSSTNSPVPERSREAASA